MSLYEELDVGSDATAKQIKSAYRKKAKKAHPDHGGKKGEFEKVQRAYLVLSNPETRSKYDATGDESLKEADNSQAEILKIIVEAFEIIVNVVERIGKDPIECDIAKEMHDAIDKKRGEIETEITRLKVNIKKTERFLGRFTIKKGQNFLEYMLRNKIEGINLNIRFKRKDVEKFEKALEIMDNLSFRVEPKKETGYNQYSTMISYLNVGY